MNAAIIALSVFLSILFLVNTAYFVFIYVKVDDLQAQLDKIEESLQECEMVYMDDLGNGPAYKN